jgi:hypothetical protein
MKQTAVEWLIEKLSYSTSDGTIISHHFIINKLVEQAKEMEKKQLCYFYIKGVEAEFNNPYVTNIEFYNKTFKNTEQ